MNEKIDSDREIEDAIELFEQVGYCTPSADTEGNGTYLRPSQAPSFTSIRKLKRRHSDYRAGPVKYYTRQEIEEYEHGRQHRTKGDS